MIKVYSVFKSNPTTGFSSVSIDRETFMKITGFSPELPYTTVKGETSGIRVFNVDGVTIYSKLNKVDNKNYFAMKTKDAKKLLVEDRKDESTIVFGIPELDESTAINYPE
jgi:hypothetical protein